MVGDERIPFFTIERPSPEVDPEAAHSPEYFGNIQISYADEDSVDYYDDIDISLQYLRSFPGVTEVIRQGRELVLVWGTAIIDAELALGLRRWWYERLYHRGHLD